MSGVLDSCDDTAGQEFVHAAHMRAMTEKNDTFDLNYHFDLHNRQTAGQGTIAELVVSHDLLIREVRRLQLVIDPVVPLMFERFLGSSDRPSPPSIDITRASNLSALIGVLSGLPKDSIVYVEAGNTTTLAGSIGSYRGYHDHLQVTVGSEGPRTVKHVLQRLRTIKKNGFPGCKGGYHEADDNNPIWIAEDSNTSDFVLAGVLYEHGKVTLVGRQDHAW